MKQCADQVSPLTVLDLLDQQLSVTENILSGKRLQVSIGYEATHRSTYLDIRREVDDTIINDRRELLLGHTERRMHLIQRCHKVFPPNLHITDVIRNPRHRPHLDMPIKRKTRRALDETLDLCTGKVLRHGGQLGDVNVLAHDAVLLHLGSVDGEDLDASGFVGKGDLDVDFETTGTEEGIIDHVFSVGHTDDQDVVELVDTVHLSRPSYSKRIVSFAAIIWADLGQQLVDNRVANTSPIILGPSLLADRINLIKDDNMQSALISLLFLLQTREQPSNQPLDHMHNRVESMARPTSFSASANNFLIFSSLAPTNLLKISGPLTTFGSRALSILPI